MAYAKFSEKVPVDFLRVQAYGVPTDRPESDGTFAWNRTTLVVVLVRAADKEGLGYTYANQAAAELINDMLAPLVLGSDALQVRAAFETMQKAVRNVGQKGVSAMAISAVDIALWDLKARLLDVPLVSLLGQVRESVMAYGSGGFTSYSIEQLQSQLGGWASQGLRAVKMKVGREPSQDPQRVHAAREAIGPHVELFVDGNGAYSRKQALALAQQFASQDVRWFEEPVSSEDLSGLRLLCERAPACMDIAAGEYGFALSDFQTLLQAQAVDVLQADVTRCGGITGFLDAAALARAYQIPLSAHTAPAIHAHLGCALSPMRHVEYFHDHARIEQLLFEGAAPLREGQLCPDPSRPGLGLELKHAEAEPYAL